MIQNVWFSCWFLLTLQSFSIVFLQETSSFNMVHQVSRYVSALIHQWHNGCRNFCWLKVVRFQWCHFFGINQPISCWNRFNMIQICPVMLHLFPFNRWRLAWSWFWSCRKPLDEQYFFFCSAVKLSYGQWFDQCMVSLVMLVCLTRWLRLVDGYNIHSTGWSTKIRLQPNIIKDVKEPKWFMFWLKELKFHQALWSSWCFFWD